MSALLASRVICLFLLLIGALIFGILPVYVKNTLFRCDCNSDTCKPNCKARKGKIITSFLIFFGGGVLLGTTFLHLLPESREAFEKEAEVVNGSSSSPDEDGDDGHDHEHFPIPEFIVCCGFFAVYLFEEVMHYFIGGHTHVPTQEKAIRSMSRSMSCSSPQPTYTRTMSYTQPQPPASVESGDAASCKTDVFTQSSASSVEIVHEKSFSLTGLLTVAALSFHSLFEGFAVGLRPDAVSTWIVFAAIAVHKYVISFVVGLEILATGGRNVHVYSYMGVFAVMSPLGMAIAMITQSSFEENNPVTVSVLNAIATGTLLYVTFFEILQRDEHKDISTWIQLIATAAGFAVMCFMQFGSTFA